MSYLLQPDPEQELWWCPSATLRVCIGIEPVSSFVQYMISFLPLLFNYFLLLFPAETVLWGLSQKGWMTSEMFRVEIPNIPKSGAKSCRAERMGWHSWDSKGTRACLQEQDTKSFMGKQELGTGKSDKR